MMETPLVKKNGSEIKPAAVRTAAVMARPRARGLAATSSTPVATAEKPASISRFDCEAP
jgi:hypothetical protein